MQRQKYIQLATKDNIERISNTINVNGITSRKNREYYTKQFKERTQI